MPGDGQNVSNEGTRDAGALPPIVTLRPNERTGVVALGNLPAGRSQLLFSLSAPYPDANWIIVGVAFDTVLGGAVAGIVVERISSMSNGQFSLTVNNQTAGAIASSSVMYYAIHP